MDGDEPTTMVPVRMYGVVTRVSREEAIAYGWVEPTDRERADCAERMARHRVEEAARRAEPGPELTLDGLLGYLDWSPEYAAHVLHPACTCSPLSEDPYVCDWARDLGVRP